MLLDLLHAIPPWAYIAVIFPMFVMLPTVGVLTLLERKVASWTQDRIGPNRAEFGFGILPEKFRFRFPLLQVAADGLKFFAKEDFRAKNVDKILFSLAPAIMIVIVFAACAIIPWAGTKGDRAQVQIPAGQTWGQAVADSLPRHHSVIGEPVVSGDTVTFLHGWRAQIASVDIGVLFSVAVLSLAVYGVVIGGWASNNKYSFLGGLRATANMISYEIPLGLSILAIVVLYGTLDLQTLVERQSHYWFGIIPAWNIFALPAVFLIFLTCLHAESNRAPFDVAEAEQELVGGYHTEYSSMRFALFFLAEYFEMVVTSSICVALFFGGWHLPWVDKLWPALGGNVDPAHPAITTSWLALFVRWGVFYGKVLVIIFIFMWTRWSLPRFRFDQILHIAWQGLIPMSLALLAVSALTLWAFGTWGVGESMGGLRLRMAAALLAGNVIVLVATVVIARLVRGPAAAIPNKRMRIPGSRFTRTPLPAGVVSSQVG